MNHFQKKERELVDDTNCICQQENFNRLIELIEFMKNNYPNIKGFTKRNIERMIQFYETYKDDEIASPLVTQLSWTNNLLILSSSKDKGVVECSISKNMSQTLISEYKLKLIDKELLENKLKEVKILMNDNN